MLKKIFMGICCFFIAFTSSGCEKTVLTPTYEQITGDYILNISVSETSFKKGEDIEVTMVFENNSGEEKNIFRGVLLQYFIVGNIEYSPFYASAAIEDTLAQGETISSVKMGSNMARGTYELIAVAKFSFREDGLDRFSAERVNIYSNTIIITIK